MSSEQMTTDTAAVDDVQNDVKAEDVKITDPPETSTPPSSPPLALNMAGQKHKEMPPPSAPASASRKRSHDDMYGESQSADIAPPASQGMDDDSVNSQTIKKSESQQSQEQQRAAKDALVNTTSQSEQLPPSGQGSQKPKSKSGKSTKTPKMAVENDATTEDEDVNSDDSESADQTEPQDQIENFDWRDLEVRYHNKMQEFDQKERAILDEFIRLVHVSDA